MRRLTTLLTTAALTAACGTQPAGDYLSLACDHQRQLLAAADAGEDTAPVLDAMESDVETARGLGQSQSADVFSDILAAARRGDMEPTRDNVERNCPPV